MITVEVAPRFDGGLACPVLVDVAFKEAAEDVVGDEKAFVVGPGWVFFEEVPGDDEGPCPGVAEVAVVASQASGLDVFVLAVVVDMAHDAVAVEGEVAFVAGAVVSHGIACDAVGGRSFRAGAGVDVVVELFAVGDIRFGEFLCHGGSGAGAFEVEFEQAWEDELALPAVLLDEGKQAVGATGQAHGGLGSEGDNVGAGSERFVDCAEFEAFRAGVSGVGADEEVMVEPSVGW